MNSKEALISYFQELPEVKRIHELEHYIDTNEVILSTFARIKEIQKQMVSSKEYHQEKQLAILEEEYRKEKEKLFELPFVEEYFELLDIVNDMLEQVTSTIENQFNKKING